MSEFAKKLAQFNVEIISTGKTAALLRRDGLNVKDVSTLTSFPEILGGRVKTLHPKVFGGLLANKKHPLHMEEIKSLSIEPFDMAVVNFYPFQEKLKEKIGFEEMLEYIDVGGPSMLRAAAKNFKNVACVSSPDQYKALADELEENKGFLSDETLKHLAQNVFYVTKEYDNAIYSYFRGRELLNLNLEKIASLRYGENPHQKGGLYKILNTQLLEFRKIQGKEISFNNLLDLDTAVLMVKDFHEPAAAIVKHASLCGVGVDRKLSLAYRKAYLTDTLSSFGGIICLNRKVDKDSAQEVIKSEFKECIIAPAYSKEALKIFSAKKNFVVLEADIEKFTAALKEIRTTAFGCLVQDRDTLTYDKLSLKTVTKKKPSARELKDLIFAWKVAKFVRSNSIVIARNQAVLGIGGGQPSRVGAAKIALAGAKAVRGAVLASDGFFPKDDSIRFAYRKGIRAIIQPGGSIKDKDIIKLCDKLKMSMLFTGIRHFRH